MRGSATFSSEQALGDTHASEIIWLCKLTDHDDVVAFLGFFLAFVGCEVDLADSSTWRCLDTVCKLVWLGSFEIICCKVGMEKLVDIAWLDTLESFLFGDYSFGNKVACDLDCSCGCTLAVTSLENPEFLVFDCKFDILHIFEAVFELLSDFYELLECAWHFLFEFGNWLWCTNTCDDIFTLCVDKEISPQ